MSGCHICGKKTDIVCDWCNTPFCDEHFKEHNTDECKRIELEQARQVR